MLDSDFSCVQHITQVIVSCLNLRSQFFPLCPQFPSTLRTEYNHRLLGPTVISIVRICLFTPELKEKVKMDFRLSDFNLSFEFYFPCVRYLLILS